VGEGRQVVAGDGHFVMLRPEGVIETVRACRYNTSASSYLPCPSRIPARAAISTATSGWYGTAHTLSYPRETTMFAMYYVMSLFRLEALARATPPWFLRSSEP
jgi:hypothetical protein